MFRFAVLTFLLSPVLTFAAKVDTLEIPSAVMGKSYKAVVALPASYTQSKVAYPVLYLLHGGFGHFDDWILKTPERGLIQQLADQYNLIIAMPEGEAFSYYLDSKVKTDSQFETYLTKEVIEKIDKTYRTIAKKEGRVITGLSMGGYGALYLSSKHPDLYCAAGSMSGALNPDMVSWKLPPEPTEGVKKAFAEILGPLEANTEEYITASVLSYADKMKTNGVSLVFDCGVDDFLIEPNRELHRRLVFNQTPHDYSERPGGHSWEYWQNSLPYQVLFFSKVLKQNGSYVK
ncbi:alpha/beta hydrolase-fold protein [Imperialibacter roseus]|uniref:Alpha/beta hydrolase-fold protein n=1 Tax=Imperialibacter roseus TaxID=1324217 RepID=A0ABZ0IWN7_9BACT|nr:alpha/beta hydrolase-fold protein [Imperialibacter roseus]WOK09463.1 alpha/beta hydrolase-fold protein [Imperialibacter roseus]|tara:strand:- start:11968 stop:12834 length:867 start_codon:yes stop_codon:yes gene_type:complete